MAIFDGPFGTVIAFVVVAVTIGLRSWFGHQKQQRAQQWVREGQEAAAQGDWARAEAAFAAGAKAIPSAAILHRLHGYALAQLGEPARAEAAFNMAIALEPRVYAHQAELAMFYLRTGEHAKGLLLLKEVFRADAEIRAQMQAHAGLRDLTSDAERADLFEA